MNACIDSQASVSADRCPERPLPWRWAKSHAGPVTINKGVPMSWLPGVPVLRRRYSFRTAPRWLVTVSSAAHCGVDGLAPASAHD
jgi:hypothetical protein